MPINFTDFSRIPAQDNGLGNLLGKVIEGIKAQRLPGALNRQQQQEELANSMASMQNKFYPEKAQADIDLTKANAKKAGMFGGLGTLTGPAGQAFSLQVLKEINPEAYEVAKKIHDMNLERDRTTVDYQKKLIETSDKRNATTLGKTILEEDEANRGFMPGSGGKVPLSPQAQQRAVGQYDLKRIKETTDPKTRERLGYAVNLHKTLQNVDMEALTMFSGPQGQFNLAIEKGKDLAGNPSPEYLRYKQALVGAKAGSKQLRQFLQDSVQPGVQEGIRELLNPEAWDKSPQSAMAELQAAYRILDTEIDTLYDMAESGNVFRNPKKQGSELEKAGTANDVRNTSEALTKENIMKTAQTKGWDKKKTDWVLKKAGY
jgi:hypothetical protein